MWENLSGEIIVGIFFVIGCFAMSLQYFGVLRLPLTRNKYGNSGNGKIDSLEKVSIVQAQIIEQYGKRLDNGSIRFEKLEKGIGEINVNVGILLDRTAK